MLFIIVILWTIMIASLILGYLLFINRYRILVRQRLIACTIKEEKAYLPPELQLGFKTRVVNRVMASFTQVFKRLIPNNEKDAYNMKLLRAGNPYGLNGEGYLVIKYTIFTMSIIGGIFTGNMLYLLLLAMAGFMLPDQWLKSLITGRKEEILKGLPNFLDMLCISVQAGLGFEAALQKVIEKKRGALADEFRIVIQEMRMGKARRVAMKDMAERVGISEVTVFVTAVIQAEMLGVSISNVLQVQAQQARDARRMQAEEKAMKAPIKMLLPLVFFIFPVLFIILLGPSFINLLETL
jgi:tight adherence protein C